MFEFFKKCFKITNNSVIVALPMILFLLCIQLYFGAVRGKFSDDSKHITTIITLWLLISGFFSGWFYMVKRAISFSDKIFVYDKDRNQALRHVFAGFFKGFGHLFLPFLVVAGIGFLIRFAEHSVTDYILPSASTKIIYNLWLIGIFIIISCISYWMLLWIPEIVYGNRNPFTALVNSTKKAFITFPKTIKLFLVMWFLFIGVNILFQLLLLNPLLYFLVMLLNYYLILYTVILIFTYYEQNFLK